MRIAVIGGTFSGNKGAAGMLESVIVNLTHLVPDRVHFDVLSIYPKRDSRRPIPKNVRIIPAKPVVLVILLPPLAILYALLNKFDLPKKFLLSCKPLRAIVEATFVLDVSGISYVDGRGTTLVYNIACNLPAIAVGTPIIKLSQALGPFRKLVNRKAARSILPRLFHIFARGQETEEHLKSLGLKNVTPAADLAFILNEHSPVPELSDEIYAEIGESDLVIGVSPSQVFAGHCKKYGRDSVDVLATYLNYLHAKTDAHIVIVAHSLLEPGKHSRNNDYHVCLAIYEKLTTKTKATLVTDDMTPSELRAVISLCNCFVACRFHSMISALCMEVPTLVLAWSHKYHEVMSEFGLEEYVLGLDDFNVGSLFDSTQRLLGKRAEIAETIKNHLPEVKSRAKVQIEFAVNALEKVDVSIKPGNKAKKLYKKFYSKLFDDAFLGYSKRPDIREGSASGGLVSSVLIDQLSCGAVTGVIAGKTVIEDGKLDFLSVVCSSEAEVLDCRTSIYSDFNHANNVIEVLRDREGVFAIVALPCQWRALNVFLERHSELREKIGLRVGLWCGHTSDRRLVDDFLRLRGIDTNDVSRFYFRKGHWRGETIVEYEDGRIRRMSFRKGYGLLQNLYIDSKRRCFSCTDHFCEGADVSFGDAWLGELKSEHIKHSMAVALTQRGLDALHALETNGGAYLMKTAPELAVQSQKRAVIWHTYGNAGRSRVGRIFRITIPRPEGINPRWNDYISAFLILAAYKAYATWLRPALLRLPWPLPYFYMLVQKTFLNF